MSYLRVKWIKGHPYLYEQASYREGSKVKTKHIRYVGKFGYAGSGSGGRGVGFTPPVGLNPKRKLYVDQEISRLKLGEKFPFERDILRQYAYHQDYKLRFNSRRTTASGYVKTHRNFTGDSTVFELGLRSDSNAFTWLHEMGHSLEYADKLVDSEIEGLRREFATQVYEDYKTATSRPLEVTKFKAFIQRHGRLFDIRTPEVPETASGRQWVLNDLARLSSREIDANQFMRTFSNWAMIDYRTQPYEIFADTVASLILDPKKAFDAHGQEGRKYLERVWIKLAKHLEEKYQLSLQRPKTAKE